jgi:HK97 family phage prohead protease
MGERMTMERRSLLEPVEARTDDGGQKIGGYGAVFNSETVIGGEFREKIAPGAFSKSIAGDVRSYFNHNSALILGRTKSGTLRLKEDERGLHYEVDLPDTQAGRDLRVSMARGDVDGSSFAFRVKKDAWEMGGDMPLRTIQEIELFEVGPVTDPAYEDATAALRSLDDERGKKELAERNAAAARARIAARKAETEQKIRGIK